MPKTNTKIGTYLKNRVRKAKVQEDLVRNVNNYKSPEMYVWSKVKKQKERELNSGKII